MIEILPHVDATLNAIATVLLISGYIFIKRGQETFHKRTMLACFCVSVLFLICYLTYHFNVPSKPFPKVGYPSWLRYGYLVLLASHVLLAALVPWMAMLTIYFGLSDRRAAHRKLARWTYPIWLYVSITGVTVYVMLYWLFPPIANSN